MTPTNKDIHYCTRIGADDPRIAYVGRVKRDTTGGVHFRLPGVQIHARFTGSAIAMEMAPYSGCFMVELDDRAPFKVVSSRCDKIIEIATKLLCGEHRLTITYCNEVVTAPPIFHGLLLGPGGEMLDCPTLPRIRLEFIGDSITCGYGNEDASVSKSFPYPSVSNAFYSYAMLTARTIGAQCVMVARSGICLNYNRYTPGVGVFHDMETLYPYTMFSPEHDTEVWDHSLYTPDIVCINLGTNDVEQPAFDKDEFAGKMVEFVNMIRSRYQQAKVVLLSGPMLHDEQLASVKHALDKAAAVLKAKGETEVYRHDFIPMDGSYGYGTLDHPTVAEHARMAHELTAFLHKLLS